MSDHYFEIFKKPAHQFVWDKHIEFIKRKSDIDDVFKNNILEAFLFFRKELGNDLLKNQYYRNHPIVSAILNKAPWSLSWLIKLYSSLKFYKEVNSSYQNILSKLLSAKHCTNEGIPFIEIGETYRNFDWEVIFEPELPSRKKPDLNVIDTLTGENIFIEVAMVNESMKREQNGKIYYSLIDLLTFLSPSLPFCGKLFESIPSEMAVLIREKIYAIKKIAYKDESMISYKDEFIELIVGHPDKYSELAAIANSKGYRMNDILSLPIVFDEFERIRSNKLKEEAKQIPPEGLGLIYFIIDPTYLLGYDTSSDISKLKVKLREFPNVIGIAIQSKMLHKTDEIFHIEDDVLYRTKVLWDCLREDTIMIFNPTILSKISHKKYLTIIQSFN